MDTALEARTATAEELLDNATAHLDHLTGAYLTPTEHTLWRLCAQLAAALRTHLADCPHTGSGR